MVAFLFDIPILICYTSIINEISDGAMEELLKVLMDPISNRILQMIRVRGQMTISDILAESIGVPRATLYRKIEKMLKVEAIYVVATNKVRGQVENVYAIKNIYIEKSDNPGENLKTISMGIMQLLGQYTEYFQSADVDVERDKLFMLNYNIALDDKDFSNMMADLYKVVDSYQSKQKENAKVRNITLFSAPTQVKGRA